MATISLFHGTTQTHAEKILKEGFLPNTCFTTDESLAEYFAECANDEHQDEHGERDNEVILVVSLPQEQLKVDWPAFEEPISIFRNEWVDSDEEWSEGMEDGSIPTPANDDDVSVALEVTTCVRCKDAIPAENISEQ
jgi:hypothetical protein